MGKHFTTIFSRHPSPLKLNPDSPWTCEYYLYRSAQSSINIQEAPHEYKYIIMERSGTMSCVEAVPREGVCHICTNLSHWIMAIICILELVSSLQINNLQKWILIMIHLISTSLYTASQEAHAFVGFIFYTMNRNFFVQILVIWFLLLESSVQSTLLTLSLRSLHILNYFLVLKIRLSVKSKGKTNIYVITLSSQFFIHGLSSQ